MPALLMCLLFVTVPVAAALTFEFSAFVPLLIALCVIAGLSGSFDATDDQPHASIDPGRLPPVNAGASRAGRAGLKTGALEFSRL